jgi:hypothetical protein
MEDILTQVQKMVYESKCHHNDGYVMKGYRDKLKEIYYYIQKELNLHYTEPDGLEVGSPKDYEYTNVDKGFSKDEVKAWKKWSKKSKH